MGQIDHHPVKPHSVLRDIPADAGHPTQHAQQHHRRKQQGHEGLQYPHGDLVAPRGGVVTHHIGVAGAVYGAEHQQRRLHTDADAQQEQRQTSGPAVVGGKGDHSAYQRQNDGKEGEVLHEAHRRSLLFFLWEIIM